MQTRAFTLRESVDPDTFGGSVTMPDGTAFDVGAALDANGGTIVTSDPDLVGALSAFEPLKFESVPDEPVTVDDSPTYDTLKKDELRALADERGVEVASDATKEQIISALDADDEVKGF